MDFISFDIGLYYHLTKDIVFNHQSNIIGWTFAWTICF
jgi:hypothetical protein